MASKASKAKTGKKALVTSTIKTAVNTGAPVSIRKMDISIEIDGVALVLASREYQSKIDWQKAISDFCQVKPETYKLAVQFMASKMQSMDTKNGKTIASNIRYGFTRRMLATMAKAGVCRRQADDSITWFK